MMVFKNVFFFILAVLCLMPACEDNPPEPEPSTLVIPGSGACETILTQLAQAFNNAHPGYTVTIPKSTGSSGGIRSVAEGSHPMGRVARRLKASEQGADLTILPFACDAVVFAVGEAVKIKSLNSEQLADIFKGNIKNWNELGGPDFSIRVLARQADETSLEIIRKFLPPFRELSITADAKIAYHDYQMVDLLNKYSGGIGFLTFGSLANPLSKIRVLALDGIMPTPDNLSSGSYPMKLSLGFVYKKDQLSGLSSKFLSFVFSNEGRAIIKHLGLFPVERR